MQTQPNEQRGLISVLVGDGRALISLTGLALFAAGGFASFQAISGHLLPHDLEFLGMTTAQLAELRDGRVLHFMIHDRVAFGGTLLAVATLYLYLANVPLAQGQRWAWWTLVVSGAVGFASFLTYLGYGYIDTWHGVATMMLMPIFITGIVLTRRKLIAHEREHAGDQIQTGIQVLRQPGQTWRWRTKAGIGRGLLLFNAGCMATGGMVIMIVGMTSVFVPQDLAFMDIAAKELNEFNPRLIPLIAHDRAGFGGAVFCCGVTLLFCVWCGSFTRALWQAILFTGAAGYGTAIGVHYPIGYTSFTHLAPAFIGAFMFAAGLSLTWPKVYRSD